MVTQSISRGGWLASIGCVLGVLSLGVIAYAYRILFVASHEPHGLEAFAIGFIVFSIEIVGWLLGLIGSVLSLIALRRTLKGSGEDRSRGIAILGLVLGGLGVVIVCVHLAYIFLFNSSTPPPVMITPSSIIPIPTGG